MGKEYRLQSKAFEQDAASSFVKSRFTADFQTEVIGVALPETTGGEREPRQHKSWYPVHISIESDGFYFCDNLTSPPEAAVILRQLIDFLLSTDNSVNIVEL